MTRSDDVTELDLIAYADGLLDRDPRRKSEVDARLASRPDDAARVRAYRAQSEALRAHYGPRVAEPIPARLRAVLETDVPRRRPWLRPAAFAGWTLAAVVSGWIAAEWRAPSETLARGFLEQSYVDYANTLSANAPRGGPADAAAQAEAVPLTWQSNDLALTLQAPELSNLGFQLTEKRSVGIAGDRIVRLIYAASDGRSFSMFLRPRWEETTPEVQLVREGDVLLAYWLEGPLASAVVTRLPEEEALALAEAVRREMNTSSLPPPELDAKLEHTPHETTMAAEGGDPVVPLR